MLVVHFRSKMIQVTPHFHEIKTTQNFVFYQTLQQKDTPLNWPKRGRANH